jgi:hypothetical protein
MTVRPSGVVWMDSLDEIGALNAPPQPKMKRRNTKEK